ncbi:hypothetical protein E4U16_005959, partial [Claviceps sp. LM84 group G4]
MGGEHGRRDDPGIGTMSQAILPDLALGSLAASVLVLAAHTARSWLSMKQQEKGERHRSQSEIVMGSHGKFW